MINVALDNWLFIFLSMVVGVLISSAVMTFIIEPEYISETELIVMQQNETTNIELNEVQTNIQLITTYRSIIEGYGVLSQVSNNLDGYYSIEDLMNSVEVYQPENSQTFYISAITETPELSQQILNEVVNAFEVIMRRLYGDSDVSIHVLSPPNFDANPIEPSLIIFILIGMLLGLSVSMIIIQFKDFMDTTVKDDNFFRELGVMNLANVSEFDDDEWIDPKFVAIESNVSGEESG